MLKIVYETKPFYMMTKTLICDRRIIREVDENE